MGAMYAPTTIHATRTGEIKPTAEQIAESDMLAKATIKYADGSVRIVAAFRTSEFYGFYQVFTAKSARTRKKNWKRAGAVHVKSFDKVNFLSDAALAQVIGKEGYKITFKYLIGKRAFDRIVDEKANPLRNHVTPVSLPAGQSTDRQNEKLRNKLRGMPLFWK